VEVNPQLYRLRFLCFLVALRLPTATTQQFKLIVIFTVSRAAVPHGKVIAIGQTVVAILSSNLLAFIICMRRRLNDNNEPNEKEQYGDFTNEFHEQSPEMVKVKLRGLRLLTYTGCLR
jgi:hypothetical protein